MKYFIIASALLAAAPAMATEPGPAPDPAPAANAQSGSNNHNRNISVTGPSHASSTNQVVLHAGDNSVTHTVQAPSRYPVSTAYAATIAPTAVCMGSTSAGAQGMAMGLSFGTSWSDTNCMLLEQVRTVAVVLSDAATAEEMMCGSDAYREARIRMGRPCAGSWKAVQGKIRRGEYTDAVVRARLGLPPLDPDDVYDEDADFFRKQ